MSSKSKKSVINFSTALFHKLVVIVVGLLIPKLFITNYGSELNGLQSSVRQFFTYIALLEAGVGASTLQSLYRPIMTRDHQQANGLLSAASYYYNRIGVLYFVALAALSLIYAVLVPVEGLLFWEVVIYILISGAITGINFFYVAKIKLLISAEGDQFYASLITTVTFLLSSVIKIVLITLSVHILLVELGYLLVNSLATGAYYWIAKRRYPWLCWRSQPDFSGTLQKGAVMVHRLASVIFQNVDVVLLTFFCSLEIVSIYAMYKMVVGMITSVVGELGNSVQFVFGQQFHSENGEDKSVYCRLIDTFNVYYSAIAFGLFTVTYILILPFLRLYTAGMDIPYIYPILPILYILMEYLMVGREAMMRTIEVAGHFQKTKNRVLIETGINIVFSIVFLFLFRAWWGDIGGVYGVLSGTVAALLYRTLDINVYANRHILHRSATKTHCIMLVNALLFGGVVAAFGMIPITMDSYLLFILNGIWITVVILLIFVTVYSWIFKSERTCLWSLLQTKWKR